MTEVVIDCDYATTYLFVTENNHQMKYAAAILAGKPEYRDELLEYADVDNKVLITFKGKTLLEHVIAALQNSDQISQVLIIGLAELPFDHDPAFVKLLPMEGPQYDKIYEGAKYYVDHPEEMGDADHILFTAGDIPFLDGDCITSFITGTADQSAEFYYSVTERHVCEAALPQLEWGSMNIKDHKFVSGGLVMIDPRAIMDKYDTIVFLSDNRKSFIWGVLRTSPWLFLKLIFGRIRLDELPTLVHRILGVTMGLHISDRYEICLDVDQIQHIDYLRSLE
ncbi:MAG: NTP transferase domain-containing protein [Candidatus Kariarchaeaceae archaeon]